MDETTKRAIKKTILALRKLLERQDIPSVLKQYGIFPDGRRVPVEKLALLDENGKQRRTRLEAIINREIQAVGGNQKTGVERYCREVAFTYLNRLIALRSMEARGLLDECIKIREDYAGRSLRHHRFLKENPGIQFDAEDTDGFKAFLRAVFRELQGDIKILFDPDDEYSIIMPTLNTLRECIRALNEDIPEGAFKEPELIGWVYQYFQTEEKNRVFEEVRTKKKKIEGDDIIPATSLYTERYMVGYLIQNSLGAIWMEMYPDSKLCEKWPYFVKDQDLKPREAQPVKSLTFLDPACGGGHFHLITFDLLAQMYEEEARLELDGKLPKEWVVPKDKIATTILESNLHGIDIDLRSVQLSYLVLYLRMREHQKSISAPKILPKKVNLVAADASLLNTPEFLSWCEEKFREEPYAFNIIKGIVGRLRNLSEIGSLARPEEDLKELIHKEKERLFSAWKKEKTPKQIPLFREMLPPEQQELPFEKITDEQFWEGVLSRVTKALDEYYQKASERGDTKAQVLAHEASRGFKFLELCNKRYDVVATNPPYMHKGNMGAKLKEEVFKGYGKMGFDLYTAFINRCVGLGGKNSYIAMITMQSFMFIDRLKSTREMILSQAPIRTMCHLGAHAFSEISGEVVNTTMYILSKSPTQSSKSLFIRLVDCINKDEMLRTTLDEAKNNLERRIFSRTVNHFNNIPGCPFVYWFPVSLYRVFKENQQLSEIARSYSGMITSENKRFTRKIWEIGQKSFGEKWKPYMKGGSIRKWYGNREHVVNYSKWAVNFYRKSRIARLAGEEKYFNEGITYSAVSNRFACRFMPSGCTWDCGGQTVFPNISDNTLYLLGLLNSRFAAYIVNSLNPTINIKCNDIDRLPVISVSRQDMKFVTLVVKSCVECAKNIDSLSPATFDFVPSVIFKQNKELGASFLIFARKTIDLKQYLNSLILLCEGFLEILFSNIYGFNDIELGVSEVDIPVGWHPLIDGYDALPKTDICEIPEKVNEYVKKHKHFKPSEEEFSRIKSHLCNLYNAGPGAKVDEMMEEEEEKETSSKEEEETECFIGKRIPISTESFLEELSVKMEMHPISIYWLLKEMSEREGVVCWSEYKRYVEDYFTVMILRMLGFRWLKQIEANEPIPEWADIDGIIPITGHTEERALCERIRDRIAAELGEDKISHIEGEFVDIFYSAACKEAEIEGKITPKKKITLAQWLEKEFFRRHISQFKKRPIAWHLTSSNGTFQVLIFCHKISLDIFKNLKNRHLARVQSYYGSLLEKARKGESVPGGLTAGKLSDIEYELEEFSNKLDKLIAMPYEPLIDDGVRVNIAPLQKLGLLASPVLAAKDIDRAIADCNRWREDDKEQTAIWKLS